MRQKSASRSDKRDRFIMSFLFLGYFYLVWEQFQNTIKIFSNQFGYLDVQHHWRILEDFIRLKMPYRDYFLNPSHGWGYLLFQAFLTAVIIPLTVAFFLHLSRII